MYTLRRYILAVVVSLLALPLFAQNRQEEVVGSLRAIDSLLSAKRAFQSLYIAPQLTSIEVEEINRWAADLQKSRFSESGLELSGGYDYRFWNSQMIDDSYEGGDVVPYKHRFLLSLKWNILQSGLVGRDYFRQRVELLSRTKSQEVVNSTIRALVLESAQQQMSHLYAHYNLLIDVKVALYGELIAMQEELVAKNQATLLSLSDMKIKRSATERMRKRDVEAGSGVVDLEGYLASQTLFVGDEYDALLESNNSLVKSRLEQELVLNEVDGISYWREVRLSPYARVSNYLDESLNRKNVGNVGVNASFPLFTNTKSKRREVISRGLLLEGEEQVIRRDLSAQVAELLGQLNDNLASLEVLVEGAALYDEGCALATQYYNRNTMTIYELTQRYIDNLDSRIEICRLLIEREELKHSLFKVIYGV